MKKNIVLLFAFIAYFFFNNNALAVMPEDVHINVNMSQGILGIIIFIVIFVMLANKDKINYDSRAEWVQKAIIWGSLIALVIILVLYRALA